MGIALAAALTQAACTFSRDSIDARYVSPSTYQAWSCPQLYEEKIRLTREVDRAGQLTLNVKSANPTQVNGTFRGDMAGGMLNVAMKNKEAGVCNHQFALEKAK